VDRFSMLIHLDHLVAREADCEAADVMHVPGLVRHLLSGGLKPRDVLHAGAANRPALEELPPLKNGLCLPDPDGALHEIEERLLLRGEIPVEPRQVVVLAVRVVVSVLGVAEFVACKDHGHALREHHRRDDVSLLPLAEREDLGIVGRPLGAAVPAFVVIRSIAVPLAVRVVVLLIVAYQILQVEAVVAGHEVDAGVRFPAAVRVEVAAPAKPGRKFRHDATVPFPEPPYRVAVLAVPLRPQHRKVPDLIPALAEVPRLGDQLHLRDDRVLVDDVEERAELVHGLQLPRERAREIEAEPIHVHLQHPVAEAVHDELEYARALHVQRVAAARVVHVMPRIVRHEPVVVQVVYAAQRERGPHVIALRRVVVNHVENHLDARRVQRAHHHLKLAHRFQRRDRRRVAGLGGEECQGVVAPVVREPLLQQVPVVRVVMHREQLHGRHPQFLQVPDRRFRRHARIRPAQFLRHARHPLGESLHVDFVDQRLVPGHLRGAVIAPRECRVHNRGERCERGVVPSVEGQIFRRVADAVGEHLVAPVHFPSDGFCIRIEQDFVRIEAHAPCGLVGTVDTIAVELAGPRVGQAAVPDHVGLLGHRDPVHFLPRINRIEKTQLDLRGVLGEEREVHACAVPSRTQRVRLSGPHTDRGDFRNCDR
jgi:hypothetical protein